MAIHPPANNMAIPMRRADLVNLKLGPQCLAQALDTLDDLLLTRRRKRCAEK